MGRTMRGICCTLHIRCCNANEQFIKGKSIVDFHSFAEMMDDFVNSPAAGIPSRNPSMPAYQSSSFFSSESFSDGTPMGRELQRQTNVHGHTMFRDNLSHISSGSASSSSASPQSIPEKSPLESEAGALKNTDAEESPSEY